MLNTYPNADNYPTPAFDQPVTSPDVDPDAGDLVSASFNADWIPVMEGALDSLLLPSTWAGTDDDIKLALDRATNLKSIIAQASVRTIDTPFWDDDTDVDDEMTVDEQPWYGSVSDPEAPPDELDFVENAAIWILTGFLAVATLEVGAAPAILFSTIAPKFVLATRRGDLGEIIRILVDGEEVARVDTSSAVPGDVINTAIIGDPELESHDIMIVQVS